MFDTEMERIGFAESTRALPGSTIKCLQRTCNGPNPSPLPPYNPDDPVPSKGNSTNIGVILLIVGLVLIAILICFGIIWYRRRSTRNNEDSRVHQRSSKGKGKKKKKGYSMQDEKEDESDEEDNLQLDYEKPMINN